MFMSSFQLFAGESGLGKSTLLNSLFLTDIYTPAAYPSVEERLNKTVAVSTTCYYMYLANHLLRRHIDNDYKYSLTVIYTWVDQ